MRLLHTAKPCRSARGFTLVEIMIVVAILGLLIAMAVPNFLKTRARAQTTACIQYLSEFEGAKQMWALEYNMKNGDLPTQADLIGPTLYLRKMPECPAGGTLKFEPVGTDASCTAPGHQL